MDVGESEMIMHPPSISRKHQQCHVTGGSLYDVLGPEVVTLVRMD